MELMPLRTHFLKKLICVGPATKDAPSSDEEPFLPNLQILRLIINPATQIELLQEVISSTTPNRIACSRGLFTTAPQEAYRGSEVSSY